MDSEDRHAFARELGVIDQEINQSVDREFRVWLRGLRARLIQEARNPTPVK